MSQTMKNKINHRQRQGDWVCGSCNNMNFAFRDTCNRCHVNKAKEEKGFKSALFLIESNGDISAYSDRSIEPYFEKVEVEEKTEKTNKFSFDKLPSIEPLLKQVRKDSCNLLNNIIEEVKYTSFEFEWMCQKCQGVNQYYKYHCNSCGSQRFRKLTA